MSKPENRHEVEALVDEGKKKSLIDAEYERMKKEIGDRCEARMSRSFTLSKL